MNLVQNYEVTMNWTSSF